MNLKRIFYSTLYIFMLTLCCKQAVAQSEDAADKPVKMIVNEHGAKADELMFVK